jgi:hypothetical protein
MGGQGRMVPPLSKRTPYGNCAWMSVLVTNVPRRGKGSRGGDFEKIFPERPFINLSSTAAFIRRLFALSAVVATLEINKIHLDLFSPEQKVGGSNPLGRTITPFISIVSSEGAGLAVANHAGY